MPEGGNRMRYCRQPLIGKQRALRLLLAQPLALLDLTSKQHGQFLQLLVARGSLLLGLHREDAMPCVLRHHPRADEPFADPASQFSRVIDDEGVVPSERAVPGPGGAEL